MLHKRSAFREVFHGFEPARVARMTAAEIDDAIRNPAIIRNRLKINAAVKNAGAFLQLQKRHGSFDEFIWSFTEGKVIQNAWKELSDLHASTALSDAVSAALKKEAFRSSAPPSATLSCRQAVLLMIIWSIVSAIESCSMNKPCIYLSQWVLSFESVATATIKNIEDIIQIINVGGGHLTQEEVRKQEELYLSRVMHDCSGLEWLAAIRYQDENRPGISLDSVYTALLTTTPRSARGEREEFERSSHDEPPLSALEVL